MNKVFAILMFAISMIAAWGVFAEGAHHQIFILIGSLWIGRALWRESRQEEEEVQRP